MASPRPPRVLIVSPHWSMGHFTPYLGVIRHLRAAGCHVGWITLTDAREQLVRPTGAEPALDTREMAARYAALYSELVGSRSVS